MEKSNMTQSASEIDWRFRVMEIRKHPETASLAEIIKLTDEYFVKLYFGDPSQGAASVSRCLAASIKDVPEN